MPEDRSLDEFEGPEAGSVDADGSPVESDPGDPSAESDADGLRAESDADGPGAESDADGPAPATPTATWTADSADCERCGERVERRWIDDGDLVCPECKSW